MSFSWWHYYSDISCSRLPWLVVWNWKLMVIKLAQAQQSLSSFSCVIDVGLRHFRSHLNLWAYHSSNLVCDSYFTPFLMIVSLTILPRANYSLVRYLRSYLLLVQLEPSFQPRQIWRIVPVQMGLKFLWPVVTTNHLPFRQGCYHYARYLCIILFLSLRLDVVWWCDVQTWTFSSLLL